jgi:hypothetical protein
MRIIWPLLATVPLIMLGGCTGFPWFSRAATDHPSDASGNVPTTNGDFSQARVELQNVSFDGETLSGRLLISPASSNLRIDKRLIESFALSVDSVVECGTETSLAYVIMDVLAPSLKEADILTLAPGFWYGKEVRLLLFASEATRQPLPQCIEAEIVHHALDVKNAARLHVRVERSQPASTPQEAGAPAASAAEGTVAPDEQVLPSAEKSPSPPQ